jgi:hypothetical protein
MSSGGKPVPISVAAEAEATHDCDALFTEDGMGNRGLKASVRTAVWRGSSSGFTFTALVVVSFGGFACGKSQHGASTAGHGGEVSAHAGETSPPGGATAFSGIDVRVRLAGSDTLDLDALDPSGVPLQEPPIRVVVATIVELNGGEREGRVPGLTILVDGREIEETASAGLPQKFSFQHQVTDAAHGQTIELELRYQDESFTLPVAAPFIELTSPAREATLAADEPIVLAWSGVDAAPDPVALFPRGSCAISFTLVEPATFEPMPDGTGAEPPCRFEVWGDWSFDVQEPVTPFRSLRVERAARRIQRLTIE